MNAGNNHHEIDAWLPQEMAEHAERVGVAKANMPGSTLFVLAVLAGAFIALGAIFATTVTAASSPVLPFGLTRLLAGLTFCLGLVLVVVAGAELFTGNNLKVMALASGKISLPLLLRGWFIVYVGNFVGALLTAALMLMTEHHTQAGGAVGVHVLGIAQAKCQYGFVQAFALGVFCNVLVCLAVWLTYSARSTTDKILSIIFPVTAFVASGFEHSVANMYFVPIGLFVKATASDAFWQSVGTSPEAFADLTWSGFLAANLLPVTLGNIVGGSVMVGLVYWWIHLRRR